MGKSKQMEDLIECLGDSLWTFCLRLTYDKLEAEDLYQDTMVKALELRDKIDFDQNPKAFIYSLAVSINNNRFRKILRRRRIAPTSHHNLGYIEDPGLGTESQVIKSVEKTDLELAINKLSKGQKAVILMFYMEELSIKEISRYLDIPEGTIKSRLNSGRKLLKAELEVKGYGQ